MTSEPACPARVPAVLDLEPGTYFWCACGQSRSQPFCDGSHAGTSFEPEELTVESRVRVALCQCKRTAAAPRCDGSHKRIP